MAVLVATVSFLALGAAAPTSRRGTALLVPDGGGGGLGALRATADVDLDRLPPGLVFGRNSTEDSGSWIPQSWSASLDRLSEHIDLKALLLPVLLGFALLFLIVLSMVSSGHIRWKKEERAPVDEAPSPVASSSSVGPPTLHNWSALGIVALTSYRFYTGFLSATWMPYLLAMEGHQLMHKQQSFFMGSAKLIYGMSILMNPMFGLVGDQMAVVSHWSGRRLFVLLGVGASGLGIYGCVVAAQIHSVWWYMAATVLWMLGEAMADVTTETLVPELLPRSQYEISSAIRALNFLLGGLAGYGALILFRHFHYSWLYYGYLVVMLICAFLTLCFIDADDLNIKRSKPSRHEETSLSSLLKKAYVLPARLGGGFPTACLCLFVFSLGSAPMFFLLLMVRDVIGIKEHVSLQMHFSVISIVFFVSAAVASVAGVATAGSSSTSQDASQGASQAAGPEAGAGSSSPGHDDNAQVTETREGMEQRWRLMVYSTLLFGVVAFVIPMVGFLPTLASREAVFYVVAAFFGLAFGSVYARFQECTWSLLPTGVDVANAMGFAAMCKLAGVGIGNFFVGILLGFFSVEGGESYTLLGYILMCTFCAGVVLLSAYLAHGVSQIALADYDKTALRVD